MSELTKNIELLLAPACNENSIELVDIVYQKEGGRWFLRITLDQPSGINLDDCQKWSRRFEEILDESDIIPHAYNLEVSSPGLNRVLKKEADFIRFEGERVKIRLFGPLNGRRNFQGVLKGFNNNQVELSLLDTNEMVNIPMDQISKANLDPIIKI